MTNATTAIARRFVLAAILVLAPCGAFAQAKGKPPKVSELLARIEEQQKEIEAQRALLATQSQQITAQDQQIAAQDKRLEEMNKTLQELALQVAQQAQAVEPTPSSSSACRRSSRR
jgi:TolA-binding protein